MAIRDRDELPEFDAAAAQTFNKLQNCAPVKKTLTEDKVCDAKTSDVDTGRR
jgi:hypothetical protein